MDLVRASVPPIKCQGIKTKLVPFIFRSIRWEPQPGARWIEPFVGSASVALNLKPERALLADTNRHLIEFYQAVQSGALNGEAARDHLFCEGKRLETAGADYYYLVRERFNQHGAPLDFLFLNRSCFNGVVRFNRKGEFNVPFGHKPLRFTKAYVTKIVNQINWMARQMRNADWEFRVACWPETLAQARSSDFAYLDPPYVGRHADYYNTWDDAEARKLAVAAQHLPCGFALSMWLENRYRKNEHIAACWPNMETRVCSHFYHVGSDEKLRNEIDEALLIKPGFATADNGKQRTRKPPEASNQLSLVIEKASTYLAGAPQ
jgi:DNA adenine methylase